MSELARTFLRTADGQLHVGIYYSQWLIEQLERHDPRSGLNDANIRSLVAFVEEINHALHAALSFQRGVRAIGSEDYARNLELQAQVDKAQRISRTDRRWLRFHLFARHDPRAYHDPNLRGRYLETTKLTRRYTRYLDTINGLRRLEEIRAFHALDYASKKQRILALPAPAPRGTDPGKTPTE